MYVIRNLQTRFIEEGVHNALSKRATHYAFTLTENGWLQGDICRLAGLKTLKGLRPGKPPIEDE